MITCSSSLCTVVNSGVWTRCRSFFTVWCCFLSVKWRRRCPAFVSVFLCSGFSTLPLRHRSENTLHALLLECDSVLFQPVVLYTTCFTARSPWGGGCCHVYTIAISCSGKLEKLCMGGKIQLVMWRNSFKWFVSYLKVNAVNNVIRG